MLAFLYLGLHDIKCLPVNDRFVLIFHDDPLMCLFLPDHTHLKTIVCFLRSDSTVIYRILQDPFNYSEVPDVFPVLRILDLPLGIVVAKAPRSVPPARAGDFFTLKPSADVVGTFALHRIVEYLAHYPCSLPVNDKVSFVVRILQITEWRNHAGIFTLFGMKEI